MAEMCPDPDDYQDAGLPSDDALFEAAYLVARGVRAMALAGDCATDPVIMLRAHTRLARAATRYGASAEAIPFVIEHGEESGRALASCGYAARAWVVELFAWACSPCVPPGRRHQITGLLLGYSPDAIGRHREAGEGRRFTEPAGEGGDL